MSDREARIAKNEAISRDINEGIEEAMAQRSPEGFIRMACECGRSSCERMFAITLEEYQGTRTDPRRFVVVDDHVIHDVERIVERTERYVVVEKRDGSASNIAEASDPRD